ncbi:MAG: TnsA endonuclease N-terminal domain-containing protein [Bacteroidetes bacterium]|nr:TnsA endonuclease N-terminal domain-containing protein [Bacteroidota bacterium]
MHNRNFAYKPSYKISYRGCCFHSLLELKYALAVEDDYRFLREPVQIAYDPKTLRSTNYLREGIKTYIPDFLVRSKSGGSALLVEIKPQDFCNELLLGQKKVIAENYIQANHLDWEYRLIKGDEIILNQIQKQKYQVYYDHRHSFHSIFDFQKLDRKLNEEPRNFFSTVPFFPEDQLSKREYNLFVRRGNYITV